MSSSLRCAAMCLFASALPAMCRPGNAQQSGPPDVFSQSFDTVLSNFEHQFVAVSAAMPASHYNFTLSTLNLPGSDFKNVRTFAAEVKHVAEMNFVIYSVMSGLKPDMDMDSIRAGGDRGEYGGGKAVGIAALMPKILRKLARCCCRRSGHRMRNPQPARQP